MDGENLSFASITVGDLDIDSLDLYVLGNQVGTIQLAVGDDISDGQFQDIGGDTKFQDVVLDQELRVGGIFLIAHQRDDALQLIAGECGVDVQVNQAASHLSGIREIIDLKILFGVGDVRLGGAADRMHPGGKAGVKVHDGDSDGDVHVRNGFVDVDTEGFQRRCVLKVVDDGIGVQGAQGADVGAIACVEVGGLDPLVAPAALAVVAQAAVHDDADLLGGGLDMLLGNSTSLDEVLDAVHTGGRKSRAELEALVGLGQTGFLILENDQAVAGGEVRDVLEGVAANTVNIGVGQPGLVSEHAADILQVFVDCGVLFHYLKSLCFHFFDTIVLGHFDHAVQDIVQGLHGQAVPPKGLEPLKVGHSLHV